jgi:hypothetical protein
MPQNAQSDPIQEFIALPRDQQLSTLQSLPPDKQDKLLARVKEYRQKGTATPVSTDPSGRTPTGEPAPGDTRNPAQKWLDNLVTPDPRREEWQSPARNATEDVVRHVGQTFIPLISHPINTARGMLKSAGNAIADNPGNAQGAVFDFFVKPLVEQAVTESAEKGKTRAALNLLGTGVGIWATGEVTGTGAKAARPVVGKVTRGLMDTAAKAREAAVGKYRPRAVEVGGENIPVMVGEAEPESSAGRLQTRLKRSGSGAKSFEKVESAQQEAAKNVIKKTAQKASGQIGPLQAEPGAVVNDAATASFAQAGPLYESLDESLKTVPEALTNVSKLVDTAIGRARKLGVVIDDGGGDISKIRPDKDGAIQWGGTRISKATQPERWAELVDQGIIDESGNGTPMKAYRNVISQLKSMQRSSTDGATRFAIGKEINTLTNNMDAALRGTRARPEVNYVRRGLDIDYQATEANLPTVKSGYTRLFRSESPTTKFGDVFNADKLGEFAKQTTGEHYTSDLSYADYFRQSYGRDARTYYIDVPNSIANKTRVGESSEYHLSNAEVDNALGESSLEKTWHEADRLWRQGHARIDVAKAITDATKGPRASITPAGMAEVPTEMQGSSLVKSLDKLLDDGTLEDAFTPDEGKNLRQSALILDRIQKTSPGTGYGESGSKSRAIAHILRGSPGPLIGGGIGAGVGLLTGHAIAGLEAGGFVGFVVQRIGEQGLIRVMTRLDGMNALEALEKAKTPAAADAAMKSILTIGATGASIQGPKTAQLQKTADDARQNTAQ